MSDYAPHSRACGITVHDHGPLCHQNCPTCRGTKNAPPWSDSKVKLIKDNDNAERQTAVTVIIKSYGTKLQAQEAVNQALEELAIRGFRYSVIEVAPI